MRLQHALDQRIRSSKHDEDRSFASHLSSIDSDDGKARPVDVREVDELQTSEGEENDDDENDDQDEDSQEDYEIESAAPEEISFAALAKAQESLGKRRRHSPSLPSYAASLSQTAATPSSTLQEFQTGSRSTEKRDLHRTPKHAPAELSSKKAVSRKRSVVHAPTISPRDPRFDPLSGPLDEMRTRQKYAFLDEYREDEIRELKDSIRRVKHDERTKEKLKRALLSMESRKKAALAKEAQHGVLRAHRKEEKEMIGKGKRPYYLKKSEQKRRVLVEKFEGMGERKVERVLERKRKKKAGRERKGMPEARRGVEG